MVGFPNSNLDTYNKKDGTFRSRRRFGEDGYAVKDLDVADNHKKFDHVHDISLNSRPSKSRMPNKQENRELWKAKKKRRLW